MHTALHRMSIRHYYNSNLFCSMHWLVWVWLTQECEGVMVAVPGQQIATVSRKLIQNAVKRVNVVSSEQTASARHTRHTGWTHTIKQYATECGAQGNHLRNDCTQVLRLKIAKNLMRHTPVRCRRSQICCKYFLLHTWKHTYRCCPL